MVNRAIVMNDSRVDIWCDSAIVVRRRCSNDCFYATKRNTFGTHILGIFRPINLRWQPKSYMQKGVTLLNFIRQIN